VVNRQKFIVVAEKKKIFKVRKFILEKCLFFAILSGANEDYYCHRERYLGGSTEFLGNFLWVC